eukprot:TRINITY_DN7076_c0_g1_i2.p1 TRINITY_DN7076_c0_g1~~TRINITY_DN7076_c0_g1_i2.p1  ORF type:complete len:866 (-),score=176.56 TRINITY_DN7076_c0_g1_i2:2793-5390(-)
MSDEDPTELRDSLGSVNTSFEKKSRSRKSSRSSSRKRTSSRVHDPKKKKKDSASVDGSSESMSKSRIRKSKKIKKKKLRMPEHAESEEEELIDWKNIGSGFDIDMTVITNAPQHEFLEEEFPHTCQDTEKENMILSWDKTPLDYESQIESVVGLEPSYLYLFPDNDVEVDYRLNEHSIFTEGYLNESHEYVRGILNQYTFDYININEHSTAYGGKVPHTNRLKKHIKKMNEQVVEEVDEENVGTSEGVQFVSKFLGTVSEKIKFNSVENKDIRTSLFSPKLYKAMSMSSASIDPRIKQEPYSVPPRTAMFIEISALGFDFKYKEPFFMELFLFDAEKNERVSETFYTDFNDSEKVQALMLNFMEQDPDPQNVCNEFVVSTGYISEHIYLIARIKGVFKGETSLDPYVKGTNISEKDGKKYDTDTAKAISSLGMYNIHSFWGTVPIYRSNGEFRLSWERYYNMDLYRPPPHKGPLTDELFSEMLMVPDSIKRLKPVDGRIALRCRPYHESSVHLSKLSNSSLFEVPPKVAMNEAQFICGNEVKYVHDFSTFDKPFPRVEVYNNLYIYPMSINLSKLSKVKNIQLNAHFLHGNASLDDFEEHILPAIYGKNRGKNFVSVHSCAINYNDKRPQWIDEIKINIPLNADSKHYVLFTLHNINEKVYKKGKGGEISTLIGFCYLPIYQKGFLPDTIHEIPFYQTPGPITFLDCSDDDILMQGKEMVTLQVRSKWNSSVFSTNKALNHFYKKCLVEDVDSVSPLLERVSNNELINHFHHIVSNLLFLLCAVEGDDEASQRTFLTLVKILDTVNSLTEETEWEKEVMYNPLLVSFVDNHYRNPNSASYPYEVLLKEWSSVIKDRNLSVLFFLI